MKFKSNARSAKDGNPRVRNTKFGNRGFTLIEMLVVISMILILLSIALPMYNNSIIRARETTLRHNLATINKCIDQYTLDKQKAPQALDDLVSAGYLKKIPDDITGSRDTWQCDQEDSLKSIDQTQPGIVGCHSGSDQTSIDGTAYSSWVY
jgi:general secretion pathway protein G